METKFNKIVSTQMESAAKKAYPCECCGILVGKRTNGEIEFLAQFPNIDVRLKNIGSILGVDRVRPTYRAETIIFESPFINALANYLQSVIKYTGEVNVNTEMNIASILEAQGQNGAIQGNNAIYGSYAQMVTPVNLY